MAGQISEFVKGDTGDGRLAAERALLGTALEEVQGLVGYLVGTLMTSDPKSEGGDITNVYKVGQNTSRLLMASGDLIIGWLLQRKAEVALTKLDEGGDLLSAKDRHFYEGKVAAAKFFSQQVLPRLSIERAIAEGTDNSLMDLAEEAF